MKPDTFRVITLPVVEPVSLLEAKQQIGMMPDQTEFDRFLMDKIATARRLIETRLSISMVATQYRAIWKAAPHVLTMPAPPLLVSEAYPVAVTVDGEAVDAEELEVDTDAIPGEITLPAAGRKVVVEYWGGVPPETQVDPMLRSAILMYVTHAFENRGVLAADTNVELPQAFETLLAASSWNGGW